LNPKSIYRQTAIAGASPVRLVILLYEQMIQDLTRAVQAIERNQIERRTREINHALTVLGYLQSTLDMERGRDVARTLVRFYSSIRAGLFRAHAQASKQVLGDQIACLLQVREAWLQVENSATIPELPPLDTQSTDRSDKPGSVWEA